MQSYVASHLEARYDAAANHIPCLLGLGVLNIDLCLSRSEELSLNWTSNLLTGVCKLLLTHVGNN